MTKVKESYIKPMISAYIIELEEGIAAASRYLVPGGQNSYNPDVPTWNEEKTKDNEFMF